MSDHSRQGTSSDFPEEEGNPCQSRKSTRSLYKWDVFEDNTYSSDPYEPSRVYFLFLKIIKILVMIITFIMVLMSSIISKGIVIISASILGHNELNVCIITKDEWETKQSFIHIDGDKLSSEMTTIKGSYLWTLFFILITPEILLFFRSLRMCFCKKTKRPTNITFLTIFIIETLHTIGVDVLIFVVMPSLSEMHSLMITSCLSLLPNVLQCFSSFKLYSLSHIISAFVQIISISFWTYWSVEKETYLLIIPLVLLCVSLGWCENYLWDTRIGSKPFFISIRRTIEMSRYSIYLFISPWKITIHITFILITFTFIFNQSQLIEQVKYYFHSQTLSFTRPDFTTTSQHLYLLLYQLFSSWLCYVFAKFAAKIRIQDFCYALPINLTDPILFFLFYGLLNESECSREILIKNVTIKSQSSSNLYPFWILWIISYLSQIFTTMHIWCPANERTATTERIFLNPMYCGALIDISMGFNRRRFVDDECDKCNKPYQKSLSDSDRITRIYACATMWHETSDEMIQFLKSIMRMDEDQSARENARKYLKIADPDYYKFETHVLFDDAFDVDKNNQPIANRYVHQLIDVIDEAASIIHNINLKLYKPIMMNTPYGGRLIWTLPGKTKLVVHLKDKMKIRHRKRWSQVMYMYYLLGHILMDSDLHVNRKASRADNTYILALDGDIKFDPNAVRLLVDLMKKNNNLGAACGRIHPIGSGVMVWYQKFEYAISHWLQKASEHVYGCVLCSPGCFSLFRARALMSNNVMKRYTTQSKEALHYVQYDQGEDRWLCTLILKSGYHVEYNAASDAYTHCPEGFGEFYTQRRRWAPSTIANVIDLLSSSSSIISVNANISHLYILYQLILMVGTILGPGTILLMVVGATNAVFGINNDRALLANLIPVVAFIFICFYTSNKIQIAFAAIMTIIYVFIMLAVIVGTILQAIDQPFSPSTIFFLVMLFAFVLAASLHPREASCLIYFLLYMLLIPSMYMLLTLYSLINLNVISWGTRESPKINEKKSLNRSAKFTSNLKKWFQCAFCVNNMVTNETINENVHESNESVIRKEKTVQELKNEREQNELEQCQPQNSKEKSESINQSRWLEIFPNYPISFLSSEEKIFWEQLIKKYLKPIESNPIHEAMIANELRELRNKAITILLISNAIFVFTIYLLQLHRDKLSIEMPFEFNVMNSKKIEHLVKNGKNKLEPLGAFFILCFAVILIIQMIGMIIHRFSTFSHIMACVELNFFKNKKKNPTEDEYLEKNAIEIAKDLQCLKGIDEEDTMENDKYPGELNQTLYKLERKKWDRQKTLTLDVAFRKRFNKHLGSEYINGLSNRTNLQRIQTIQALKRRKFSTHNKCVTHNQSNNLTREKNECASKYNQNNGIATSNFTFNEAYP